MSAKNIAFLAVFWITLISALGWSVKGQVDRTVSGKTESKRLSHN